MSYKPDFDDGETYITTTKDMLDAMNGHSSILTNDDLEKLKRLPALYAYSFDFLKSSLAAELFVKSPDTYAMGIKGWENIYNGYKTRETEIKEGRSRLHSRHVMGIFVITKVASPSKVHGFVYLQLYRNPLVSREKDRQMNAFQQPELLYRPAAVGEYHFTAIKDPKDGLWRFKTWVLNPTFASNVTAHTFSKSGERLSLGASSSLPSKL